MSMFPQSGSRKPWEMESGRVDTTVARFFNMVYAWMAVGIAVTGVVAYLVAPHARQLFGGGLTLIVLALGAFGISIYVQTQFLRLSANVATVLFLLYAAIMGALCSSIFLKYDARTLVSAFGVTAGTFVGLSVFGMVTKRDLTRIGSLLITCLWGLIIASVVNMFFANSAVDWFITYGILIVFIGITAYETQMLKAMAQRFGQDPALAPRFAIYGSLVLYISFINIFLSILRIFGDRR